MKKCLLTVVVLCTLGSCPPVTGPAYFLVTEYQPFHGDSYILLLHAAADIQMARDIVRDPSGAPERIVVAAIEPGTGEPPNRDMLNGGTPWSWHVTEFLGFAGFTIEILDGWPTFIEEDVAGWMANTQGTIGFWNYTVMRELTEAEVFSGILQGQFEF